MQIFKSHTELHAELIEAHIYRWKDMVSLLS